MTAVLSRVIHCCPCNHILGFCSGGLVYTWWNRARLFIVYNDMYDRCTTDVQYVQNTRWVRFRRSKPCTVCKLSKSTLAWRQDRSGKHAIGPQCIAPISALYPLYPHRSFWHYFFTNSSRKKQMAYGQTHNGAVKCLAQTQISWWWWHKNDTLYIWTIHSCGIVHNLQYLRRL